MITELTVRPDDVLCLAQLLKRWPYQSAERVSLQVWDIAFAKRGAEAESNLDMYVFNGLQRNSAGEAFLDLACVLPKKEEFEFYCDRCGDIFFLKWQTEEIEAEHPEHPLRPDVFDMEAGTVCCDDETRPLVAKAAIYALCHGPHGGKTSFPQDFKILQDRLYPWLGPIAPDISGFGGHTKSDEGFDHSKVTYLLNAAQALGQNDKKVLAQIVAHRHPNLTWEQLARHIDGVPIEKSKTPQLMRTWQKRGRSLLGKD